MKSSTRCTVQASRRNTFTLTHGRTLKSPTLHTTNPKGGKPTLDTLQEETQTALNHLPTDAHIRELTQTLTDILKTRYQLNAGKEIQ